MYNRYIPQPDGSYRRNQVQDPANYGQRPYPRRENPQPQRTTPPQPQSCEEPPRQTPPPCPHMQQPRPYSPQQKRAAAAKEPGIGSFLRQLLPQNFDTEDLLIVLLLLLMSADRADDQNTALLTLAIYLFL